jgi:hypothetical protein
MLTLATGIMMFTFSCFRRKEYTYPNTGAWIKGYIHKWLVRWNKYDPRVHQLHAQTLAKHADMMNSLKPLFDKPQSL